jgi:Peptidase family M28
MHAVAKSILAGAASVVAGAVVVTFAGQAPRTPAAPRPQVGPPLVPLAESYLQWPLPASESAYGRIDGRRLHKTVDDLAAISRKSRDAGNQWWGRITGTPAHAEAQQYVADKLRGFGAQVRFEEVPLPPVWYAIKWDVNVSAGATKLALKSAHPVLRSAATPPAGLDLDAIYVGLGTPSDFAGRDVRGKAVFIYSIPTPSALAHSARSNGALKLAEDKGAAAVVIIMGIPGNFSQQLWGSGGEGPNLTRVPWFSVGLEDGTAARELLDKGETVKVHLSLTTETRTDVKPSAVFGVMPGATDENILVIAHSDGFWEAAVDNASGVAAMLGLAEYYSKIPREKRRRTITFMSPIGHHVTPDLSLAKLHENRATVFAKTALIINAEHVTTTQTYNHGDLLRKSNAATGHRFYVGRSKRLAQILLDSFKLFGVALYELPSTRYGVAGDLSKLTEDAPGIEVIESNVFYHTDHDTPDIIPSPGLESITRGYAKIIDEINKLDLKDIVDPTTTSTQQR